jgi:hypothetical protein
MRQASILTRLVLGGLRWAVPWAGGLVVSGALAWWLNTAITGCCPGVGPLGRDPGAPVVARLSVADAKALRNDGFAVVTRTGAPPDRRADDRSAPGGAR